MTRDALPIPYSLRQAANATTVADLESIFVQLAKTLGSKTPTVDFSQFIENAREFEERYTFWDPCNAAFARLRQVQPAVISYLMEALRQGVGIGMELSPAEANDLKPHMLFLEEHNILRHEESGSLQISAGSDPTTVWDLYPLENLNSILTDTDFQFAGE